MSPALQYVDRLRPAPVALRRPVCRRVAVRVVAARHVPRRAVLDPLDVGQRHLHGKLYRHQDARNVARPVVRRRKELAVVQVPVLDRHAAPAAQHVHPALLHAVSKRGGHQAVDRLAHQQVQEDRMQLVGVARRWSRFT